MIAIPFTRLQDFVREVYAPGHPGISPGSIGQLLNACNLFDRFCVEVYEHKVSVQELTESLVTEFMSARLAAGIAPATVNSNRRALMCIWRFAAESGCSVAPNRVRLVTEPERIPSAWTPAQFKTLLEASKKALYASALRSLLLVLYDTDCRFGAVANALISDFDSAAGTLVMTETKTDRQRTYPLSPETVQAILAIDRHELKFRHGRYFKSRPRWDGQIPVRLIGPPSCPKRLRKHFTDLLKSCGMSATRKDKFQRVRRTKYTAVYKALGKEAASEHAGHRTDMSRWYLDTRQLVSRSVIDAVPPPS